MNARPKTFPDLGAPELDAFLLDLSTLPELDDADRSSASQLAAALDPSTEASDRTVLPSTGTELSMRTG